MRILLAVDGSTPADRAAGLLASLPWATHDHVRILSVAPARGDILGMPWGILPSDSAEIERAILRLHSDAIERAVQEVRPASAIVDQAGEMGADLIVVGHRGLGAWESRLLGSVSAEVVDHAPCPVLVVRDDQIGPIVLGDDGSPDARAAAQVICDWPVLEGLPVTVVGVVDDGFPYVAAMEPPLHAETMAHFGDAVAAERRSRSGSCESVAEAMREAGVDTSVQVRNGDPAHEIVAAARAIGAGLVVVGTRGETGLRRLILGSVARNVLLSAPCSVLLVRAGVRAAGRHPADEASTREVVGVFG